MNNNKSKMKKWEFCHICKIIKQCTIIAISYSQNTIVCNFSKYKGSYWGGRGYITLYLFGITFVQFSQSFVIPYSIFLNFLDPSLFLTQSFLIPSSISKGHIMYSTSQIFSQVYYLTYMLHLLLKIFSH